MTFIGVDIGGTNIRLIAMDVSGRIVARRRFRTSPERGAQETIGSIIDTIQDIASDANVGPPQAIGIGITGPVDMATGIVSNPYTLGDWPSTDLRAPFTEVFNVPVVIDNDANVAAVGEWWVGAGRGTRRMTMVTIGTGIGVASLIDGKLQRTTGGQHGEAGHMVLDPSGPQCYCGARGCWEVLASGTAIERQARAMKGPIIGSDRAAKIDDEDQTAGEMLFAAAAAGDAAAQQAVEAVAEWTALGLVNLAATAMPDIFVMSGGVMAHYASLHPLIVKVLKAHSVMIPTDIPVVVAELGDDAGAVGAGKQAIDTMDEQAVEASSKVDRKAIEI